MSGPDTTPQYALGWFRREILEGRLRPGQWVRQEDVAERIGVSVAPVREALRILEQEGQVTYIARRGYFVTELRLADLEEIYDLRRVLEGRAARHAVPTLDDDSLGRIEAAARECVDAAGIGDVAGELAANRRFHFGLFEAPGQPHAMRLIRLLWDSTEAYRALYYNSPLERQRSIDAHDRILEAIRRRDVDCLIEELDVHREQALEVLRHLLDRDAPER